MKSIFINLVLVVLGFAIGGTFALYNLKKVSQEADFMLTNGPWKVNPSMDLKNPKQRALIAMVG